MTLKQLQQRRGEVFNKLKSLKESFDKNGGKWANEADAKEWNELNAKHDELATQIEVASKYDHVEREVSAIVNPLNIGLDDAGNGRVGARRAPGHGASRERQTPREYVVDNKGRKQPLLSRNDSMRAEVARRNPEAAEECKGLTVGGMIRASVLGPRNARERNALHSLGGSTGGFTVPHFLAAELIDLLRSKSRVVEAGAKTIRMEGQEVSYAKLASDPTPTWASEGVSIEESGPTFSKINFTAYTLRMLVKVSRELLEDSINLQSKLPEVFTTAMGTELDRVALLGTGAGTGSGTEPLGVLNYTGINSVSMGDNGATPADYNKLLDAVYEIELDNAETPTAAIMHPRTKRTFDGLQDTTDQPLNRPPSLANMRFLPTTKMSITETQGSAAGICSSMILGGFEQMVIALRSDIRIDLLPERYADTYQYGFLVSLRGDCGAFQESAFCKIIGIKA